MPETQADLLSPCPTIISLSSSVRSRQSKGRSMISLEEALMNENIEIDEDAELGHVTSWMESHNTPSFLMKMSKSKNAGGFRGDFSRPTAKSMITQLENCDNVSASLLVNHRMSSIVFSSVDLDIEFILPKGRAGPLVVPYICYDKYSTRYRQWSPYTTHFSNTFAHHQIWGWWSLRWCFEGLWGNGLEGVIKVYIRNILHW